MSNLRSILSSIDEMFVIFMRYAWILLLFALLLAAISIPRSRFQRFFASIDFRGYNGKLPRYIGSSKINKYLLKVKFKSKIPLEPWKKAQPQIEQFKKRRIYNIEQPREDIGKTEVYFIQEELPNSILWNDSFLQEGRKFAVGEGYRGQIIWDAASLPHGLVAGATGGGKTALLRCIVHQAILKKFNVSVLDFKQGGDFSDVEREAQKYRDLEKGYGPFLVSDPEEARQLLLALVVEVRGRMERFKERGVTSIDEYNAIGQDRFIPWLLVIDEAAEVLDVKPTDKAEKELYAEINQSLRTLARMSRAAGVHILMGFIRPDANVLDGQIKNNLLWRVCGYFADPAASRIVLDNDKATELPPEIKGRFIIGEEEAQAYYLPPSPPEGEPSK